MIIRFKDFLLLGLIILLFAVFIPKLVLAGLGDCGGTCYGPLICEPCEKCYRSGWPVPDLFWCELSDDCVGVGTCCLYSSRCGGDCGDYSEFPTWKFSNPSPETGGFPICGCNYKDADPCPSSGCCNAGCSGGQCTLSVDHTKCILTCGNDCKCNCPSKCCYNSRYKLRHIDNSYPGGEAYFCSGSDGDFSYSCGCDPTVYTDCLYDCRNKTCNPYQSNNHCYYSGVGGCSGGDCVCSYSGDDTTVGTCSCTGTGTCDDGYCLTGSTCYHGVTCGSSGWSYSGTCSLGSCCTCGSKGCSDDNSKCDSRDGWYCDGDTREYRDYYCSNCDCDYTVSQEYDCHQDDTCRPEGNGCTGTVCTCSSGSCSCKDETHYDSACYPTGCTADKCSVTRKYKDYGCDGDTCTYSEKSCSPSDCSSGEYCSGGSCSPGVCNSTWACSTPGKDNGYNDGGSDYCQATCDGEGNCDYPINCKGDGDYSSEACACGGWTWDTITSHHSIPTPSNPQCCGDDGVNDDWCNLGNGSCVDGVWYDDHCEDGIQNCDEAGVDCGGTDCGPCNQPPTADSVSDSPDPVNVGSDITFTGRWTEPDSGDNVKMYICKDSTCSNCDNTSQTNCWCFSSNWNTEPDTTDTCNYTALDSDAGQTYSYWLGVCDDSNACDPTPLPGGTFTVNTPPKVKNLDYSLGCISPIAYLNFTYLDDDGDDMATTSSFHLQIAADDKFEAGIKKDGSIINRIISTASEIITANTSLSYLLEDYDILPKPEYHWRVRVRDSKGSWSDWVTSTFDLNPM